MSSGLVLTDGELGISIVFIVGLVLTIWVLAHGHGGL